MIHPLFLFYTPPHQKFFIFAFGYFCNTSDGQTAIWPETAPTGTLGPSAGAAGECMNRSGLT